MKNSSEVWKDIPGYEGLYQINILGKVYSLLSNVVLKEYLDIYGYHTVNLYKGIKKRNSKIHRLVMLTFEGPSNLQVNHINGIKTDNRLENLEYCTDKENKIHAAALGLINMTGENNIGAVLSEVSVRKIKSLLAEGKKSQKEIGAMFGIGFKAVSKIKLGQRWKHVK